MSPLIIPMKTGTNNSPTTTNATRKLKPPRGALLEAIHTVDSYHTVSNNTHEMKALYIFERNMDYIFGDGGNSSYIDTGFLGICIYTNQIMRDYMWGLY